MNESRSVTLSSDLAAWHFLSRTTFGPRALDLEAAKHRGISALLDEQLHPQDIDDSEVERKITALPTLTMSQGELMEDFPPRKKANHVTTLEQRQAARRALAPSADGSPPPAMPEMAPSMEAAAPRHILIELEREQFWRAAYSRRQLQEVMVHFWMNHFNVYAGKGVDKWLLTSFERDAIRPHALGNFWQLLTATAQSPAMLFYLDNWLSVAPNGMAAMLPALAKRGLNENYGRELMELHTLGVDGGYTQQDVREVARCFTGWTIDRPRQGGGFVFRPRVHDLGEKVVLGHRIPAGGGMEDGMAVLKLLAAHPSTARFISLKLCRYFVSDDPPASVVERTARTFTDSQGDIPSVVKTILTAPEFNTQAAFRAKVKSPFELVASALRTLDAETDAGIPLMALMMNMGQPLFLYQAPTGFPDRASWWINSGTLLARMNFSMALAADRVPGTQLDFQALTPSDDTQAVWDHLVTRTLGGQVSPETTAAAMKGVENLAGINGVNFVAFPKTKLMAALLLGSPEFQRK